MQQPPKHIYNLLSKVCPSYLWEGIAGDLEEQFCFDIEELGLKKARRNYFWNAVKFLRPGILLRNSFKPNNNTIMVSNYLKTAGRSMARRKLFTFINAFGLSIGIAFCILIFLFIKDERSFDTFHDNAKDIYRLNVYTYNTWNPESDEKYYQHAYLQAALGPVLKEELSEVKYMTRFNPASTHVVKYGDKVFSEDISLVDPDFFKMFSFEVHDGNKDIFLNELHHIVLTQSTANKYFGDENPIGKSLIVDIRGEKNFEVVGVLADPPANSSLDFEFLIRQENRPYYQRNIENWGNYGHPTFVQLQPNSSVDNFTQNLKKIRDKYMGEKLAQTKEEYNLTDDMVQMEYRVNNLLDIHLNKDIRWHKVSDPQYAIILGTLALLILVIASINYISLALTTSTTRCIEVGVRKSIGAQPKQLFYQFTFESVLLSLISMILGVILMYLFLPVFNDFTNKSIQINGLDWSNIITVGILLALLIGFLGGMYPAIFLSRFKPMSVLKGRSSTKLNSGLAKPLVLLQFTLSSILIISAFVMYEQMRLITTKDLGFDKEQVIVVPTNQGWNSKSDQAVVNMRNMLSSNPNIIEVSGSSSSFNRGYSINGYQIEGQNKHAYVFAVDDNYLDVLGIELKEGRNFDPVISSDTMALIVNEALVNDMGWDNPLEEHLNWREDSTSLGYNIIGVVKDYNFLSLQNKVEPLFLSINREDVGYMVEILIKVKPEDLDQSIADIRKAYKTTVPDKPFDYTFLDDDMQEQYASFERWMKIMGFSTLFALLISGLGLFGLAGINAVNRTKEIGIRKVFGAPIMKIFLLLNRQFVLLVLLSFVIAGPAAYYFMNNWWLNDFEFKIEMGFGLFATSFVIGLLVAIVTVSYHGIKAASMSPSDTLRHE